MATLERNTIPQRRCCPTAQATPSACRYRPRRLRVASNKCWKSGANALASATSSPVSPSPLQLALRIKSAWHGPSTVSQLTSPFDIGSIEVCEVGREGPLQASSCVCVATLVSRGGPRRTSPNTTLQLHRGVGREGPPEPRHLHYLFPGVAHRPLTFKLFFLMKGSLPGNPI
jgi:hypothetical protein